MRQTNAYSIQSTWSCYWLDQFLTLALNTLILSIFYISLDLSTIYFAHFSGCRASFVCSCHSIPECCVMFSGVKLSMGSFVLFLFLCYRKGNSQDYPKSLFLNDFIIVETSSFTNWLQIFIIADKMGHFSFCRQ